ncbi:MAG: hypothetical protein IPM79_35610 [Polyangiaceae bacterium]|nr:hypothetical protein [Polyangiaceae bacterium]MBK8942786.1 hypothetical protein [Polyangiaceae bacterium]
MGLVAVTSLGAPEASADTAKKTAYVAPKPTAKSQTQKSVDDRGGVNPCNTKEPSPGVYEGWNRAPSMGQMMMPARGGVTKDGRFDVVIHFHGHDPVRKEFVRVMDGAVLVGITLGIGSGAYSQAFGSPQAFKDLIASVEDEVAKQRGLKSAKVRKLALSAWSAGYGAVEQILRQEAGKERVDAVILLDGLHVGYNPDGTLQRPGLEPFIEFAKRAKAGKRFMFASHSSIIPPGYASTTETVNYVVHELGGKEKAAKPRASDPMGLELNAKFDAGNFHARGYDGNDKMDHCAHIGLLRDVFKSHLKPRWKTPKGLAKKVEKPKPEKVAAKADKPKADKPKAADKKRDGKKAPDKKKGADPPRAKTAQR